ncbi:hypothetical protein MAR_012097 [Mya arenaria]|uniref:VWFC domain-containing protein n=1 Tax=Mya arenaria TaxID=6604 RepID=A0ABY7FZS7_MYAAR|nr:hypothetical protein MAR_012097 [Mya arenaria]
MFYLTFLTCSLGMLYVTKGSTTWYPTTTPRPTTVPGSCFWEGKWYHDGDVLYSAPDGCNGGYCEAGGVVNWDHECYFYTPDCFGQQIKLPDQCCPLCLNTTTPPSTTIPTTTIPTTTPRAPPGACVIDNKVYANGEEISRAQDNCYGTICSNGQTVSWDHECFLQPPYCSGIEEKLPDKCCPLCHTSNTTTPPPTTIPRTTIPTTSPRAPPGSCVIDDKVYANEEEISRAQDNCYGTICSNGQTVSWDHECFLQPPYCSGVEEKLSDQCCPLCHTSNTTTAPPPSTSSSTNSSTEPLRDVFSSTPSYNASTDCLINGRWFEGGTRTSTDPCKPCFCLNGKERCSPRQQCSEVQDCPEFYTPQGQCCPVCGSSADKCSPLTLCLLAVLSFTKLSFFNT